MEGLDIKAFGQVARLLNDQKKVTPGNAGDEFLKMLCMEVADKMFSEEMSGNESLNMDLAKKLFAEKLARQIKEQGTLPQIAGEKNISGVDGYKSGK